MSQTLHQIYQSKAIVLARTMVVKFHNIATAINQQLIADGYVVDENDPTTWKYYMNMFGEYHQSDYDRLYALSDGASKYIQIKIAGETQAVDANFTKELMYGESADQAVANEYRFNTHYYNTLITKYPEFEDLILGVLNPVPLDLAINAQEGEILYCGGYLKTLLNSGIYHYVRQDYGPISENFLIEANEENLIPILQDYIYNYISRWWNANYAVTNDLFHAYFIAAMMLTIPQILGNIRLGNAKTAHAHSFHIREYLESNGTLGWIAEYLPKSVLLWLYRNLIWLDANRGKQEIFNAIVDNVLTEAKIPISGFRLRHDVSAMGADSLTPTAFMEKKALNINTSTSATRNEIIDIVNSSVSLATENYYNPEGQATAIQNLSRFSLFDNLNTKVLESTVIDLSNHMAITKEDIGLNLWLYCASQGTYRGTVIFTNPLTNERIQLTPLNAYILAFYCFNKAWANYEFEYIPTMFARMILRHPRNTPGDEFPVQPTVADLVKGVTSDALSTAQVRDLLGNYTPDFEHSSSTSFSAEVNSAHAEAMRKYNATAKIEDARGRGYAEWVTHQCYWYDIPCPMTKTDTKYSDWLTLHGITFDGFNREDYVTLALEIVEAATGVNLNASDDLRNKQTAGLAVLKHFASYTIQIIQNTVASDSYWLDWKTTRITNDKSTARGGTKAQLPTTTVVDETWSIKDGPIWFSEVTDQNTVKVKEYITQKKVIDTVINVTAFRGGHSSQLKLPMFGVVDARIPDIVIDKRTKVYRTLTSVIYPLNAAERIGVGSTIGSKVTLNAPSAGIRDGFAVSTTIGATIVVSPPMTVVSESAAVTSTIDNTIMLLAPRSDLAEATTVSSTINNRIVINPPSTSVDEGMTVSTTIDEIVRIEAPVQTLSDTMTVTTTIQPFIEIVDPTIGNREVTTVQTTISSTIEILKNEVAVQTNTATTRVGIGRIQIVPSYLTQGMSSTVENIDNVVLPENLPETPDGLKDGLNNDYDEIANILFPANVPLKPSQLSDDIGDLIVELSTITLPENLTTNVIEELDNVTNPDNLSGGD